MQTESSDARSPILKSIGGKKKLIYCFLYRRKAATQDLKSIGDKKIRLKYSFLSRRRRPATPDQAA